jgi:hypothetical protein
VFPSTAGLSTGSNRGLATGSNRRPPDRHEPPPATVREPLSPSSGRHRIPFSHG